MVSRCSLFPITLFIVISRRNAFYKTLILFDHSLQHASSPFFCQRFLWRGIHCKRNKYTGTVICLQFWAYGSWDTLFPITMSPTAGTSVSCVNIRNCFWLCVVKELISSKWKVIASCADSYTTDIFFSCKRVINEWTHTIHNCKLSRTHQYTRRQEINKKTVMCVSFK